MSTLCPAAVLDSSLTTMRRVVVDLANAGESVLSDAVGRQADRVATGEAVKIGWAHDCLVLLARGRAMSAAAGAQMNDAIAAVVALSPVKAPVLAPCMFGRRAQGRMEDLDRDGEPGERMGRLSLTPLVARH